MYYLVFITITVEDRKKSGIREVKQRDSTIGIGSFLLSPEPKDQGLTCFQNRKNRIVGLQKAEVKKVQLARSSALLS